LDLEGATSQGKHLHYLLVESEKDSATAPVVFWFNGVSVFLSLCLYFVCCSLCLFVRLRASTSTTCWWKARRIRRRRQSCSGSTV
jgi:hypothetical protein